MQEKIELNRVRTFSEIIEDSIQFFKQTWKPLLRAYFSICGFFWVASIVVSIFNTSTIFANKANGESAFGLTYFLAMAFELFNFLVISLTVLSFIALYKEKGNEPPTVQEVWSYVKYFFFRIFGSYLALGALTLAGFICCLIPGIYFVIVFSLTMPIIVMENATLGYAFSRSFQIIKNNWWFTVGILIVTGIIIDAVMFSIAVPVMIVTWATTFLTLASSTNVYLYALAIISHLVQFLYLLPLIAITLTYFSLTEQKDDGTLLQRIMMIGKHDDNSTNQALTEEY